MLADVTRLCPACQRRDKVLDARSQLAVHDGDWETALQIITGHCFPTYAGMSTLVCRFPPCWKNLTCAIKFRHTCVSDLLSEFRKTLIATWWKALLLREESKLGRPLSILETVHLRRKVGCDGDHSGLTYDAPCVRGPPNIGYHYGGC